MNAQEKKQEIRREMLKKRAALLPEYIKNTETDTVPAIMEFLSSAAAAAAEKAAPIAAHDDIGKACCSNADAPHQQASRAPGARRFTVMSYMSYKNEFPTHELNKKILEAGFRLVLPYTDNDFNIIPCIVNAYEELVTSKLGIPEPVPARCDKAELSDIDVILMPGVAFDARGNRIGFGKGCYDRFIASGSADDNARVPLLAALAYDFQITDLIPSEKTDMPCQVIITESGMKILKNLPA